MRSTRILSFVLSIVFIALCLSACHEQEKDDLPAGYRGQAFNFGDKNLQNTIINQMYKNGIPYFVDERGFVQYLLEDQAEVQSIIRTVRYGDNLSYWVEEIKIIGDKTTVQRYTEALDDSQIPYRIRETEGDIVIVWAQVYGPAVDIIFENIDRKVLDDVIMRHRHKTQ